MNTDYIQKMTVRNNDLDHCGIGHDVQDVLHDATKQIGVVLGDIQRKIYNQLHHDLLTNAPCGVLTREQCTPEHAIQSGLVAYIGSFVKFDIYAARKFAAEILEDVNDHGTAKMLFDLAEGNGEQCKQN